MTDRVIVTSGSGRSVRPRTKVMTRYTPESGSGLQDT